MLNLAGNGLAAWPLHLANARTPVDGTWSGVLVILALGLILAAGVVGWMAYLNRVDDE